MKRKLSCESDIFSGKSWSISQKRVLTSVLSKGSNVFITGAGGVGKSECVKQIVQIMRERGNKVAVTAHTGIAAITIEGQTLWSFLRLNEQSLKKPKEQLASDLMKKKYFVSDIQSYRALIIDEISMVDPVIFELIHYLLQILRRNSKPFGGMQVVLVGDFFQLPSPETRKTTILKYVFQTDLFWNAIDEAFDLQEMWRQKDPDFIAILHRARKGNQTTLDIQKLHERIGKTLECESKGIHPTKLFARNDQVEEINFSELSKLPDEEKSFRLRYGSYTDTTKTSKSPSSFSMSSKSSSKSKIEKIKKSITNSVTIKLLQNLGAIRYQKDVELEDIIVPPTKLKVGAQVMLSYNLDTQNGLVNGARGVLIGWSKTKAQKIEAKEDVTLSDSDSEDSFSILSKCSFLYPDEELPIVTFACGKTIEVPYVRYTMEKDGNHSFVWRIALKLAWATSIHKSQSLTLDAAEIDLSNCFAPGMAYVALSRVSCLQNIKILKPFSEKVFMIDQDVVNFYDSPFSVQKILRKHL